MSAITTFFADLIGNAEIESVHAEVWVRKGPNPNSDSPYVVEIEMEVGISKSPFEPEPQTTPAWTPGPFTPVTIRREPDPVAHDEDEEEAEFFNIMEAQHAEEE